MSHSHLSQASKAASADVSSHLTASSDTLPSTKPASQPASSPARPLDSVMLAIQADAARDAAGYLRATAVPFGGE